MLKIEKKLFLLSIRHIIIIRIMSSKTLIQHSQSNVGIRMAKMFGMKNEFY